jgi:oligoendopeptidase F
VTEATLAHRSSIAPEHTWNAESVFASAEAWDAEAQALPAALAGVTAYQGRLGDSPDQLVGCLQAFEDLLGRVGRLSTYALMDHHVDTTDQAAARRYGQAQGLFGQMLGSLGFIDPELLAIGREKLDGWTKSNAGAARYAHYIDDLYRRQAHVRSTEVEQILGMLADPFSGPRTTANLLTNADLQFAPAHDSAGNALAMNAGAVDDLLLSPDREVRRTAWESQTDGHLTFKNTLASNLATSIKQNVFATRVRQYDSTLEAALFENNLPVAVFHNLIDTFKKNLPTWHRYWAVRRKALGVETLQPYDIWAPLTGEKAPVSYTQAVDMVCAGLAPLGEEYVGPLRRGCLEERWIDIYANQGKTDSQFSGGWRGTHPFILMRYSDDLFGLSTLAHELGHSMHSYLTWQTQPQIYSQYSLFAAEVASNFNQAMVRAHLLSQKPERAFEINLIEEAMSNFHRYFFIMPTLARFELEVHQRVEQGRGLTATDMIELMADLFAESYGEEMAVDRQRVGITWATFGHLYADYYVFQYATGISGAHALAKRILDGVPGAREAYLQFLKSGGSLYPLEALRRAGVDLTTPQPLDDTFAVLAGMVDRLEALFDDAK